MKTQSNKKIVGQKFKLDQVVKRNATVGYSASKYAQYTGIGDYPQQPQHLQQPHQPRQPKQATLLKQSLQDLQAQSARPAHLEQAPARPRDGAEAQSPWHLLNKPMSQTGESVKSELSGDCLINVFIPFLDHFNSIQKITLGKHILDYVVLLIDAI